MGIKENNWGLTLKPCKKGGYLQFVFVYSTFLRCYKKDGGIGLGMLTSF